MATSDNYNSDSDQQQQQQEIHNTRHHSNSTSETGHHGTRRTSGRRFSFDPGSVTSDNGGRRSSSSGLQPGIGVAEGVGTYWEGRDLSRRPNIHRSHLSSSIQTDGTPPLNQPTASVRAQTANLAALALQRTFSDSTFKRIDSTPPIAESYNPAIPDDRTNFLTHAPIAGGSPPPVLDDLVPPTAPSSHRQSMLTHLLRTSPPEILEPRPAESASEHFRETLHPNDRLHLDSPHLIAASPSPMSETSALLPRKGDRHSYGASDTYFHEDDNEGLDFLQEQDLERQGHSGLWSKKPWLLVPQRRIRSCIKNCDKHTLWSKGVVDPVSRIPAVILGLLLNILDALSYGMILFPLGQPIFEKLGPDGISMFYVSCIISQLVYSLGGSVFKGGIGSEMIEVVPFFHTMAFAIMQEVGEDNPKAVVATTILAFSLSSVVTGLVFFALGALKLGSLIGFFPRHILVGCIGGVGWFLFVTGIEVAARLEGNLAYNLTTFKALIRPDTFPLWITPLGLAVLLMIIQRRWNHPLIVPIYFMCVPLIFYLVVLIIPNLDVSDLRRTGWVFEAPSADQPWWHFYTLYDFKETNWGALAEAFPAMLALTFFGILHVPINVPALGVSTGEDNLDVDRELIAHGVSNALSGFCGSIQNYLVYTNSLLFIRSGGNSRVAGVLLAIATTGILFAGTGIIGFIPIMVVGALIFLLGMDLLIEALYDTWGRVNYLEYFTIMAIIFSMAAWDFVFGILVGIILSTFFFVIQASRKTPIRATFSGSVAKSTVRRHPFQQKFLKQVARQIYVCKLSGYMFFGTIGSVEKAIREFLEDRTFEENPIRYLVMDFTLVPGVDYSAAETFIRMRRLLDAKAIHLILSGVKDGSDVAQSLQSVGMWSDGTEEGVKNFEDLNAALEWCENDLLRVYYEKKALMTKKSRDHLDVPKSSPPPLSFPDMGASPRQQIVHDAAASAIKEEGTLGSQAMSKPSYQHFRQPMPLLMQIFHDLSDKNEDFWFRIAPFFAKETIPAGTVLWNQGDESEALYLLESGILRASYDLEQGVLIETIVAGTVCGELPFLSETRRSARVQAEQDCVAWKLDREGWRKIRALEGGDGMAAELLRLGLKLTTERMETITSYMMTSS